MTNAACHPLPNLRVVRPWEKATVIGIGVPIPIGIPICLSVASILVLSVSLLLLADIDKHEKSRRQPNNQKTLKHSVVNVKIQVIIVTIFML